MNLPENVVAGTHNTEEGLNRRLTLYREQNNEEDTILNYFDELEIHPHKYGLKTLWCKTLVVLCGFISMSVFMFRGDEGRVGNEHRHSWEN